MRGRPRSSGRRSASTRSRAATRWRSWRRSSRRRRSGCSRSTRGSTRTPSPSAKKSALPDDVLEAVPTEELLGELMGKVVDVWANAHGLGRASATRREFGGDRVPRHTRREGFRFLGAFDPGARLVGFVYGYTGAPGQWWYDKVAAGLDAASR